MGSEICAAFANGYVHHYQFQQAFNIFEAWQRDFPDDPEPHLMRGKIRQRWKSWPSAESAYREALKRDEDLFEARLGLAQVLVERHKYDEAQECFRICLHEQPNDDALLAGWADCLMNLGRSEEAADVYRRILSKDEDDCSARLGLAKIALADQQIDESIDWVEPAVNDCPRRPDLRYTYAQALIAADRQDEAAEHFRFFDEANSALMRVSQLTLDLVEHPQNIEARLEVGKAVHEVWFR